ncbi:hypothetical protein J6590_092942 [Homalodisca vitripennis]|nr:hypothetical protein J6590_092942 [Homalodisca vitripennis]
MKGAEDFCMQSQRSGVLLAPILATAFVSINADTVQLISSSLREFTKKLKEFCTIGLSSPQVLFEVVLDKHVSAYIKCEHLTDDPAAKRRMIRCPCSLHQDPGLLLHSGWNEWRRISMKTPEILLDVHKLDTHDVQPDQASILPAKQSKCKSESF